MYLEFLILQAKKNQQLAGFYCYLNEGLDIEVNTEEYAAVITVYVFA